MKTKKSASQQKGNLVSKAVDIFIKLFLGVRAGEELRNRRRLRLLSAFLLLMTLVIFSGALSVRTISLYTSYVMLGTSGMLLITYFISRTRFAPVAVWLAILLPAIPPTAVVFFKPEVMNLAAELMWVTMPLLIASLMLPLRKAVIVAVSYITYIIILATVGSFGIEIFAPLVAYLVVIAFFVITITHVRSKDQSEIEHQLLERRQAEKALRESEEKFSQSFMLSPQQICITRLKDGKIIEINDSYTKYSGWTREEIIGKTSTDLNVWTKPGDRERMLKILKKNDRVYNEEFECRNKKGEIHTQLFSAAPITVNGEECLIAIMTDISERKRIEKALKDSEERFRRIFEQGPLGIAFSNMDRHFSIVNKQFCNMLGYTEQELRSMTAKDISFPEDMEIDTPKLQQLDRGEISLYTREKRGIKKNKEVIWENLTITALRDNQGKTLGFLGMIEDITQRKMIEEALLASENKFNKAFHASPDAICIGRIKDWHIIEVNDSLLRMTGFTREELINHRVDTIGFSIEPSEIQRIVKTLMAQKKIYNEEFTFTHKDGQLHKSLVSIELIDINGEACVLVVATDITERQRMEDDLRESEEKFHSIVEHGNDGIVFIQDGMVQYSNSKMLDIGGYIETDILNKPFLQFIVPEQRELVLDTYSRRIRGEETPERTELILLRKDGRRVNAEVSASLIKYKGKTVEIAIVRDVTKRKQVEQELRESEEKFSKAFHASPQQIMITRDSDDTIVEVNDSFIRGTGYTRDELIGHQISAFNAFVNPEEFQKLAELIAKQRRLVNEEFGFRTKSGEIRRWLCSAEVISLKGEPCVIYVVTDITERKQMEEAIRESEEKFSKIFQGSSQLIAVSRSDTNTYIDVNDAYVKTTGYSRDELIGHSIFDINMIAYPEEQKEITRLIKENVDINGREYTLRMKSGELRSWICTSDTIHINNIPCSVATATDVTERNKAAEELRRTNIDLQRATAQLQATNKELESFSYSVSHDLRSPLRSIDGFSQALLEDYTVKLDDKGKDYLNRVRNASQKMGELIDGLLRLSRLTRSEMHRAKVDLGVLGEDIISRLKETEPKRRVKFILGNDLVTNGDPELVRVLLENLLGNAWKFTAKNPNAEIELGKQVNGKQKSFFIRDNGAGFDMAFKDKLFGAFQRLHDVTEFPGTGIGLATVQRIINRHGGTISVEGKVGKGATFYFNLNGEV